MASPEDILARVRAAGANIVLDGEKLTLVAAPRIGEAGVALVKQNRAALVALLRQERDEAVEERAAIIEFDGRAPREWAEQFARILFLRRPAGVTDMDWSWFITTCGRIIDEAPRATT